MRVLIPLLLFQSIQGLFPGRAPDEGDVRHLYPVSTIAVGIGDHAHMLPYLIGWMENLQYPKQRIQILFYYYGKEDTSHEQLLWWHDSVTRSKLYSSVEIFSVSSDENWMEAALKKARRRRSSRIMIFTANQLPLNDKLIQSVAENKTSVVTIPLFDPAFEGEKANVIISEREDEEDIPTLTQMDEVSLPLIINLDHQDSGYLTFDGGNVLNYQGPEDPFEVMAYSAHRMDIPIWLHRKSGTFQGVHFEEDWELPRQRRAIRYWLANRIASGLPMPGSSRYVRPYTMEPELYKTNKIYLINLARRPDRLKRMTKIFELLGVDFTVLEAVDGKNLPNIPMKPLPGYLDPFHKRPMKAGEIGCLLSHYKIWTDVVENDLKRVIVFEDDLRFTENGLERIMETLHDLDSSSMEWDLIYLGRKKQSENQELWITGHRHLSSVEYSYWTLGYILSNDGARKLINANPLEKMVPVDEYLPIMFDKHPNKEWSSQFSPRDLKAFTLYPLTVFPQKYTNEPGYISDTEDSVVVQDLLNRDDRKEFGKDEL